MKENKNTDGGIAERIAEVALLRTGLVDFKTSNDLGLDFVVCVKDNPDKIIGVEVKEFKGTSEKAMQKYRESLNKIAHRSSINNLPIIFFLIDSDKESGYFSTVGNRNLEKKVYSLKMDVFTKHLKETFKIFEKVEFPPYKFYQHANKSKYSTWAIALDEKQNVLQLNNVVLSPISEKKNLVIEVLIDNGIKKDQYLYVLSDLHVNPVFKDTLFFVGSRTRNIDIKLPKGRKTATIKVNLLSDVNEFDLQLNCRYL